MVVRILPLNTMNLLALNSYQSCDALVERFTQNLQGQGFALTSPEESISLQIHLRQLLLKDILNSDVPYLTEFQNMLYYGMPKDGNIIGRRNG